MVDPFTQVKLTENMAKFNIKSVSNRGTFCSFSFSFLLRRSQNVQNVYETFINTKIPFWKRTFLDHRVQNVPEISSKTSLLGWLETGQELRREENSVEFL